MAVTMGPAQSLGTLIAVILVQAASAFWNDCGWETYQWPRYCSWDCYPPCGPFGCLPFNYPQPYPSHPYSPQPYLPQPYSLQPYSPQPLMPNPQWCDTFWKGPLLVPETECSHGPSNTAGDSSTSTKNEVVKHGPCLLCCHCTACTSTCRPITYPTTPKPASPSPPCLDCCNTAESHAPRCQPPRFILRCCFPWRFPYGTKFLAELIPPPNHRLNRPFPCI